MSQIPTDVRGSWRRLTEAIFRQFCPGFCHLGQFPLFSSLFRICPSPPVHICRRCPRTPAGADGGNISPTQPLFLPFMSISSVSYYFASAIFRLPSTYLADVHGRPRKMTESDESNTPPAPPWFLSLRPIFLCLSPFPHLHLPPPCTYAADVHGRPRRLTEAKIWPTPPLFIPFGQSFSVFLIISRARLSPGKLPTPHAG